MQFDTDVVLDWQQRGMNARVLGLSPSDNPVLRIKPEDDRAENDKWRLKAEAWLFGWSIEDAIRN